MKRKLVHVLATSLAMLFVTVSAVSAHAGVQEKQVGIGKLQTFTFGVPNEKEDASSTGLRLVIPAGVEDILVNTAPGWQIDIKKETATGGEKITEVSWTGGTIPPGQRGIVSLTAQAPSQATTLVWKAYQTYSDGETVAWDKSPEEVADYQKKNQASAATASHADMNAPRPWSETKIVNDLTETPAGNSPADTSHAQQSLTAGSAKNSNNWISYLSLLIGTAALALVLKDKIRPKQG